MKKAILLLFCVVFISTVFVVPTALASEAGPLNTSSWSWTMEHRFVDGKDNGQTHNMDAGDMVLSGSVNITSSLPGAVGPNTLTYEIREDRGALLPDRSVDTTSVVPHTSRSVVVFLNAGNQSEGTYYIRAWTAETDGHTKSSSGTLSTD